jgi:hypothetical protein
VGGQARPTPDEQTKCSVCVAGGGGRGRTEGRGVYRRQYSGTQEPLTCKRHKQAAHKASNVLEAHAKIDARVPTKHAGVVMGWCPGGRDT